ncbi:MAG: ABC transporter ATP-binding protein [Gemmiger sp.]|nr:ABC transporter ATP-binding protein [Gemmiger sp.]
MLQVTDLKKVYHRHGKAVGLVGASFTVPDGQVVGILGENGAGKTTLLRSLAGLLPGVTGSALFDGLPAASTYREISYMTGEGSYFPCLTVGEYGQYLADLHPAFSPARYVQFLDFFHLQYRDAIHSLSTGQKARVELAAGFAKRCRYYLMDEPFLGKDVFTRRDFIKLMSGTLHGGETILLSTHYLDEVEYFLDRALVMQEGAIARDVLLDDLHAEGQTLLQCCADACGWQPERRLRLPL